MTDQDTVPKDEDKGDKTEEADKDGLDDEEDFEPQVDEDDEFWSKVWEETQDSDWPEGDRELWNQEQRAKADFLSMRLGDPDLSSKEKGELNFELAAILHDQGDHGAAIAYLAAAEPLLEDDLSRLSYHLLHGSCCMELGEREDEARHLTDFIKLWRKTKPNGTEAMMKTALFFRAMALMDLKNFKDARKDFKELCKMDDWDARGWFGLGAVKALHDKDVPKAIEFLERARSNFFATRGPGARHGPEFDQNPVIFTTLYKLYAHQDETLAAFDVLDILVREFPWMEQDDWLSHFERLHKVLSPNEAANYQKAIKAQFPERFKE